MNLLLKFGNTVVRNSFIANFCAKTMPYRGLGSGIMRALKEEPNLMFINDFDGVQFISVIERPYNEGINEIETLILTFLEKNPGIKVKDISKYINKGIATTERYIKSLKEKGLVVYVGARKTGGYYKK
ncbi:MULTISPECIES: winged helix-turn-helix transcriptional regulator [Parabacteroides]|uniref:winged helix-turn-helix transcriptional regulator n=1 Tax=Parabacteroides TaxID=375288 RepID=UPI001F42B514|nr:MULTISPECIES: winged helix-turn-helix transcriptional regulator [Parabacteroides]